MRGQIFCDPLNDKAKKRKWFSAAAKIKNKKGSGISTRIGEITRFILNIWDDVMTSILEEAEHIYLL